MGGQLICKGLNAGDVRLNSVLWFLVEHEITCLDVHGDPRVKWAGGGASLVA